MNPATATIKARKGREITVTFEEVKDGKETEEIFVRELKNMELAQVGSPPRTDAQLRAFVSKCTGKNLAWVGSLDISSLLLLTKTAKEVNAPFLLYLEQTEKMQTEQLAAMPDEMIERLIKLGQNGGAAPATG